MKIIKGLHFRNISDKSKYSIIDVSGKKLRRIIKELKKDNNVCLEIENKYYTLQKNNEQNDCYNCAFFDLCSCSAYIRGYGYDCLSWSITDDDYHTFRKVEEYEIVFGDD